MSHKTNAVSSFKAAANRAGGAHLTREAREATAERFVSTMYERGLQVRDAESVKLKHVQAYVEARQDQGASVRTIQNEVAHLRGILRAEGREVTRAEWSNKGLGIAGSTRNGTNRPIDRETAAKLAERLGARDPGLRAMVALGRELGLRQMEAIRSAPSLARWERELASGGRVTIVAGTKGGRLRESAPADRQRALAAVREARAIAEARGGKILPGTLKQAQTYARNALHRVGKELGERCTFHGLRYGYAVDRLNSYREAGYSERDAKASTSLDLGHGDGRGAYVAQVYARGA